MIASLPTRIIRHSAKTELTYSSVIQEFEKRFVDQVTLFKTSAIARDILFPNLKE